MRNIDYILIDSETGFVVSRYSVPARLFPPDEIPEGRRLVATAGNDTLPIGQWQFDLTKVPDAFNIVPSYADVITSWRPKKKSRKRQLEIARINAIEQVDRVYAKLIAEVMGPLQALYAEKRRQAEAGGGPLVVNESDRVAILANARSQDERIAELDKARRELKKELLKTSTMQKLEALMLKLETIYRKS